MSVIWHNGAFRDNDPVFTVSDRLRLGDGVFDTMLAVDGKPVHADLHFTRLETHGQYIGITLPAYDLAAAAKELLALNGFAQGCHAVTTIVSRGPSERGLKMPEKPDIQSVMSVLAAPEKYPPVHAIITQVRRNAYTPLTRIKSCNYGDNVIALSEAECKGGNEAIMLNSKGMVACGSSSNIFAVLYGKLVTPPTGEGVMDGITRRIVMEKMGAVEQTLSPEDLVRAEGIYLTSSIRGVVPVVTLDGKTLKPPSLPIDKNIPIS